MHCVRIHFLYIPSRRRQSSSVKNTNRYIAAFFLACLAVFLIPKQGHSCAKKQVRNAHCCSHEHAEQNPHEGCYQKTPSSTHAQSDDDCAACCHSNACRCSAPIFLINTPKLVELPTKQAFVQTGKRKFCLRQAYHSSGFSSIWLPPPEVA